MLEKIVSLTKRFIAIKSDSDNAKALEKILTLALSYLKGYTIEHFEKNGVKSALIYNRKRRPKKFKIILNGHLDVIPGTEHQYTAQIRGHRLYGVGSMDMKANLVCLIMAFKKVANMVDYPLALQIVTDEQVGGFDGTLYQIERGVRADFVIAGEPTNLNIVQQAKGILWLKISCQGKTAHGAYPWRGENAIWKMQHFLQELEKKYPTPKQECWETSVNLSKIETNNRSFNKIPDDCTIWLDIRYTPDLSKTIVHDIKKIIPRGWKLEILAKEPALFVEQSNLYLKKLQSIAQNVIKRKVILYGAQGSSDARHYSRVRCVGVEFGPIGGGIGTDNEWVNIPSLQKYYDVVTNFLLSLK